MRNIMLFTVGTLLLSGCVATQNNEVVQDDPIMHLCIQSLIWSQ